MNLKNFIGLTLIPSKKKVDTVFSNSPNVLPLNSIYKTCAINSHNKRICECKLDLSFFSK